MAKKINPKNQDNQGRFIKDNKAALKWTVPAVIDLFTKILQTLTEGDESNPVRANDIKLFKEACLIHGISSYDFSHIQNLYPNEVSVLQLIKKIKDICECRLSYSGSAMDIFILKNHYDYKDKSEQDISINKPVIIDWSSDSPKADS